MGSLRRVLAGPIYRKLLELFRHLLRAKIRKREEMAKLLAEMKKGARSALLNTSGMEVKPQPFVPVIIDCGV